MGYEAKVLADSLSPAGVRLLTVQVTFPRFILAEVNTHRVFSRNSASSRAIPPEDLIKKVMDDPFIPETFNSRVKGMGVGAALREDDYRLAVQEWLSARDAAVEAARGLLMADVDKSRVNRLLEPFMWHTAIISSTEWDNFFALRSPEGDEPDIKFPAQLEFQKTAIAMRTVMRASEPQELQPGEWHLPLVSEEEKAEYNDNRDLGQYYLPMVSSGRCARVSYDTHENYEQPTASFARAARLEQNGHLSPHEHPATPPVPGEELKFHGNFRGWFQLRGMVDFEENRVGYLDGRKPWYVTN